MREGARTKQARRLRRDSTLAEGVLWRHLRDRGLAGAKFRRQHPVGPYVADLCCLEAMVIVEVDGSQHGPARDAQRTAILEAEGFMVFRCALADRRGPHPEPLARFRPLPQAGEAICSDDGRSAIPPTDV